jgi:hypothetical protein
MSFKGATIFRIIEPKILGEINGQWVTLMSANNGRRRFLYYNFKDYNLDGYENIDNLTLEEAIKIIYNYNHGPIPPLLSFDKEAIDEYLNKIEEELNKL